MTVEIESNNVFGVVGKHPKCKICNGFVPEVVSQLTMDIIFKRRTYHQIIDYYNPLRIEGTTELVLTNIHSHKQHCQPEEVARKEYMRIASPSKDPLVGAYAKLYNRRYSEAFSRMDALYKTYAERVQDFLYVRGILEQKQHNLTVLNALVQSSGSVDYSLKIAVLEQEVIGITKSLSDMQSQLAKDLLIHLKVDRQSAPSENLLQVASTLPIFFKATVVSLKETIQEPQMLEKVVSVLAAQLDRYFGKLVSTEKEGDVGEAVIISNDS